jgi:glycosyltransferase involved in cell wall biosynthesis
MKKSRPYVSVVIPAYNASVTLIRLLASLKKSRFKEFEVIIGDDGSFEPLAELCQSAVSRVVFPVRFIRLSKNHGPAGARNVAAARAIGNVLVFLDSDVEVYPDTIGNIARKFKEDDDLTALTGVWDKDQRTNRFFPQYKALRDWSYWINERDSDGYYYLFSTRIAAIRRRVFERLGGFNVAFRQMEDVEITYRIARRYAIIFAPDVRVHHEFEGFWAVAKKYFWRSFYWTRLYSARRKFDPVATTLWESIAAVTGVGAVAVFCMGILVYYVFPLPLVRVGVLSFSFFLLTSHIFLLRKFLFYVYTEKGIVFMVKAMVTGIVLYCFVVTGGAYFQLLKLQHERRTR